MSSTQIKILSNFYSAGTNYAYIKMEIHFVSIFIIQPQSREKNLEKMNGLNVYNISNLYIVLYMIKQQYILSTTKEEALRI